VTLVVLAAIVVYSLRGSSTDSGAGGTAAVGEVAETSLGGTAPATGMLPVGTAAPDLKWTLGGSAGSVAESRGTPLVLEFLATWCPHCQAETPVLNRIHERYAGRGVKVIGVSASPVGQDQRTPGSIDDLRSFASRYGARYPLLFDRGLVGAQRYGVRAFPTIYVVDRSGAIIFAQSGEVPEATLAQAIDRALADS
jgi:peroxiredoxin